MINLIPGAHVEARGLRWELVGSQPLGPQTLVRLRGLDGPMLGRELDLLTPLEEIQSINRDFEPEKAAQLSNWRLYHEAFLLEQSLGRDALASVQPGRLRMEPYQLVPVHRAIRMSRPRLLLADVVGLGKTVQTGLVITELMARRIAHRILIVTPAGPLLEQWKTEMSQRFGLRFDVIDRAKLEEVRRSTELGSNPFDHIALGLVSIDFLKQERVLEDLERTTYDVVVIDEAHHCMDVGTAADKEDSQRRRLAQVLSRQSDSLLLATATPHDGNDRSFASLVELLDPSLVNGRGELRGEAFRQHVVRRLKRHIKDQSGKPMFQEREVHPAPVTAHSERHAKFIEAQTTLLKFVAPELKKAIGTKNYSNVLAFIALLKRSVSSIHACKSTLSAVRDRLDGILTEQVEEQRQRHQRQKSLRDMLRKQATFGVLSPAEETEQTTLQVEDIAQSLADIQREAAKASKAVTKQSKLVEGLDNLIDLCEQAIDQDPKIAELIAQIRAIRAQEPKANILVYTEYVDTQQFIVAALNKSDIGTVLTMSGDDDADSRGKTTARFTVEENLVLVSTDAAAEGLNLHHKCHHLIHFELPFNPNRLEQRNGRIDRFGQSKVPIVRYLYLRATFEERILLRLIAKYERQRKLLTFVPNTLGVTTTEDGVTHKLLTGILKDEDTLFQTPEPTIDLLSGHENETSNEATKDLLEEIDRTLKSWDKALTTQRWLGDEGLNADPDIALEAQSANQLGTTLNGVDLLQFVLRSTEFHGGSHQKKGDIYEISIPAAWTAALQGIPGFDPEKRLLRLTNNLEITRDAGENEVGFLGRAHPLVRIALDQVRHITQAKADRQDQRVSAAEGDVTEPTLVCTFLGRIQSDAGRELEQVIAVKVTAKNVEPRLLTPSEWLVPPTNAIRTTDVWSQHFKSWAPARMTDAESAAKQQFTEQTTGFLQSYAKQMRLEKQRQDQWIATRAKEILPENLPTTVQMEFGSKRPVDPSSKTSPSWTEIEDPRARLAAAAQDRSLPATTRAEANGAITLLNKRLRQIEAHENCRPPEISPIGMLMLIPSQKGGR